MGRPARCVNAPIGVRDKGHTINTGADTTDGTEVYRQLEEVHPPAARESPYGRSFPSSFSSLTGNPSWMSTGPLCGPFCIDTNPAVATPPDATSSPSGSLLAPKTALSRLQLSKLIKIDYHIKFEAVERLWMFIFNDPSSSKRGWDLVSRVQMLTDENEWAALFAEAFIVKAEATWAKRVASSWRFNPWTEANGWLDRHITAGEACLLRRGFLVPSGFKEDELDQVERHTLECTLPSWAAKGWYLTILDRFLWGYNLTWETQSASLYGRDERTRIASMVYQMVRDTKNKNSCPHASQAKRAAQYVGLLVSDRERERHESSDDDAARGCEATESLVCDRAIWNDFQLDKTQRPRCHVFSDVTHIRPSRDDRKFVFGRRCTECFNVIKPGSNFAGLPICLQ